ncbi:hypothetical protein ND856_18515 [Leptospira bandrabouensis]|uniref:hypothetical protein n=1 Tax=Leptospira bandrabouensis TaxID=2484903 RepID=UPI00223D89A3|nr:hypothetical protein [Leptospira bandrabouensis]MCW7460183.1 hypothetical protein [Leptospira bandrabouensis]MCW7479300.1 hypothetical protein [Leptospira bandrabouensis]MCW7486981.1 hypothetical protein [Leptospira bandrabouensis]
MKYILILGLFLVSCISGQAVSEPKNERVRNVAIWGSEEDVKLLEVEESINFENIDTLEPQLNESLGTKFITQKSIDIDIDLWKGIVTQSSAEVEREYILLWEDGPRNEFLNCFKKYIEWENTAKKQKDYFTKSLCNIPVQLEFYNEDLGKKVCLGNSNLELNFSSYSISPFTELQFVIPETKVYGDGCDNYKIKRESFRVASNELKKMANAMSDETIRKFTISAIAKKRKINSTYK